MTGESLLDRKIAMCEDTGMLGSSYDTGSCAFATLLLICLVLHLLFAGADISLQGRWVATPDVSAGEELPGLNRVLDRCAEKTVAAVFSISGLIRKPGAPEKNTYEKTVLSRGTAVFFFGFLLPFSAFVFLRGSGNNPWFAIALAFLPFSYLSVLRNTGCSPGEAVVSAAAVFSAIALVEIRKAGAHSFMLAIAAGILAAIAPRAGLAAGAGLLLQEFAASFKSRETFPPRILLPAGLFSAVAILLSRLLGESFTFPSPVDFPIFFSRLHEALGFPGLILLAGAAVVLALRRDPAWLVPALVFASVDSTGRGAVVAGVTAAWCTSRALADFGRPARLIMPGIVAGLLAVGLIPRLSPGESDPMISALRWMRGVRNCRNIPRNSGIWIEEVSTGGNPVIPPDNFTCVRIGGRPNGEEFLLFRGSTSFETTSGYKRIKTFGGDTGLSLYSLSGKTKKMFVDSNGDFPLEAGRCYLFEFPGELIHDSEADPVASHLKLFEDGEALGPPHAPHRWIRGKGGGFYSHWGGGKIYFSTSDNTDPNKNGRRYHAVLESGG